jgi:pullulanase
VHNLLRLSRQPDHLGQAASVGTSGAGRFEEAHSHNSYNLPDSVNLIDWSLKKANRDVFAYFRGLIALRKAHPAFRLRTAGQVRKRLRFRPDVPAKRCLAYTIDGAGLPGESQAITLVLLNGEATDQKFNLPPGRWQVLVDADRAGTEILAEVEDSVPVKAHSGIVLAAR